MHSTVSKTFTFGWFDWLCFWYPPGWLILFNRHWQQYHADPEGWNWVEYILFFIPGGFYLAVLIRWLRLGCRAPKAVHRSVDVAYQKAFADEILTPILKHYFRAELFSIDKLPQTGPLIIATNHAGMCFPWDIVSLAALLNQTRQWHAQPLAHPLFFDHPWLRWWLPAGWLEALGGVPATLSNFEAAVSSAGPNSIVLYAPEGWHGLAKGWRQRYQLTTFDPSFIRLSTRYKIPILPIACIGSETLHPWTINIKSIGRRLGLPIFPLSVLLILFLFFPSMGVWANRTRLRYYIQTLEQPWEDNHLEPHQSQKRTVLYRIAQKMRSHLQSAIDKQRNIKPVA
ncbi:glycerol acyltransferase [Phormidium tenue FACHB-886]|nr:glycerol acyltransferase [Phormidium tenue FACHB-886]